jgi:putative spermidine/putrescine transport system ATP-binding protein
MTKPLLSLKVSKVQKRLGSGGASHEVRADFAVGVGERLVITGPSGSGKTSLLRVIAGLIPLHPSGREGRIFLESDRVSPDSQTHEKLEELTFLAPEHREMGFVFQTPALFPHLSVSENAAFGLQLRGVEKSERLERARTALSRVGLGHRLDAGVHTLSGGEQQRVALVRAWIWMPRVLLFDEPLAALDEALREDLRSLVLELHQAHPVPLIWVTHDHRDRERIATRYVKIDSISRV